uniref:Uncharacterized protein n=1 Tax=viral metagenome TaxID=1070528 RepID=A0A6C0JIZ3_9ZZZZ
MDWIPFFIAILLLIILVNINVKEGFSNNVTSELIEKYEKDLLSNLYTFGGVYLYDIDRNITTTINRRYSNINYDTSNEIDFNTYTKQYRSRDPSFVFINELTMNVKYTSIYDSDSYNALQTALISCQNIINIVGSQINDETSLPEDLSEYKILLICIKLLNDINDQYKKFSNVFNSSISFTDISGLSLLEYQETIVQIIKSIQDNTPLIYIVCQQYFQNKEFIDMLTKNPRNTSELNSYLSSFKYKQHKEFIDFLSTIKISDITNNDFKPIIDMLRKQDPNYDENIKQYTFAFDDLIEGRFSNRPMFIPPSTPDNTYTNIGISEYNMTNNQGNNQNNFDNNMGNNQGNINNNEYNQGNNMGNNQGNFGNNMGNNQGNFGNNMGNNQGNFGNNMGNNQGNFGNNLSNNMGNVYQN